MQHHGEAGRHDANARGRPVDVPRDVKDADDALPRARRRLQLQRRLALALVASGGALALLTAGAHAGLHSVLQSSAAAGGADRVAGAVPSLQAAPLAAAALVLHLGLALLLWHTLPAAHPHARLGPAHGVTLGRATLVVLLAALALVAPAAPLQTAAVGWALVVVATLAATLDAVDGPLARRSGMAGPAGARFDMETDALLVLVLSLLLWRLERAGAWVLASGLLRYAFVGAAALWPWLAAPLPPSTRRKAVCVLQIVVLIVALGPIVPLPFATALAAGGLAALLASFAIDIVALARRRVPPTRPLAEDLP